MATVASLIANPVFLRRNQFNVAKPSAGRHASVSFSSSAPNKFIVKSFSTTETNRYCSTITTDSGRHASLCPTLNAIKNHHGVGKPLGRVGGKWSTKYPYNPRSQNPSDSPWPLFLVYFIIYNIISIYVFAADVPSLWVKSLFMTIVGTAMGLDAMSSGKTSVVKLQVSFSGQGIDLGFDLNQIAESGDTSTYKGLSYVLNETIVALLRHREYLKSCTLSVDSKFGREASQNHIDRLSINERLGHKETLVNVNDMKLSRPTSNKSYNVSQNDDIMVTLFVGAKGKLKFYDEFEDVLQELRTIGSSNYLTAVEVLWTPQISPRSAATST